MRSLFFLFTVAVLAADTSEAVCSSSFSEVGDRCLRFFPEMEVNWSEAQSSCVVIGGHLAEVDTCEMLGEISTFIAASGNAPTTGAYWIGATDLLNEGEFVWVNNLDLEVPVGVPFWGSETNGPREPNGGSDQNCVAIPAVDNYHFHDMECDNLYGVLCEEDGAQGATTNTPITTTTFPNTTTIPITTTTTATVFNKEPSRPVEKVADFQAWKVTCPVGYTDVDGKCYLALSEAVVTWEDAIVTCDLNRGRLAYVDQCDQLTGLSQFLQGTSPYLGYWIGFTDENSEGVYQYVNGTVVDLPLVFWGQTGGVPEPSGQTRQNCVGLHVADDFYFHDLTCSNTLAVLCEADAIPDVY